MKTKTKLENLESMTKSLVRSFCKNKSGCAIFLTKQKGSYAFQKLQMVRIGYWPQNLKKKPA